jgi:Tn3 transposase DDE domain-containing protein
VLFCRRAPAPPYPQAEQVERVADAAHCYHSGEGLIAENDRLAQRKIVKYNHLLSNCLLFYTMASMSHVLGDLRGEGYPIDAAVAAALSPYTTGHVIRFGHYSLDLNRVPMALDYEAPILSTPPEQEVHGKAPR